MVAGCMGRVACAGGAVDCFGVSQGMELTL